MATQAALIPEYFVESSPELLDRAPLSAGIDSPTDIERSEYNVRRWMSYLPEDCVRMMIRMKWDVTT